MVEESTVFGTQGKQKYGLRSSIAYNMRAAGEWDKKLLYYQGLMIIPNVAAAFLGTLLPAEVVRGLEEGWSLERLAGWTCLLAVIMWLCHAAGQGMETYLMSAGETLGWYYAKKCIHKMMDMDYDVMERNQKLTGNTWKAIKNEDNFCYSVTSVPGALQGVIGVVLYGVFIARANIWLLPLLLVSQLVSGYLLKLVRKKHGSYHARLSRYAKRADYVTRQSMESSAGKDIRIYQMAEWFVKKNKDALREMDRIFRVIHNWYFFSGTAGSLMSFGVSACSYILLLYQAADGTISISQFVLLIGLINGFTANFDQLSRRIMELNPFCTAIGYIREFLEIPDRWKRTGGIGRDRLEEMKKAGVQVELRNVSYTYEGSKTPVISGLNLVIRPGEKLALLGLNGAGKTTLVKLICGFYWPTEGEILINGIPMGDFTWEEYFSLISVLFQDSTMLPFTLDENLTGKRSGEADQKRLEAALGLAGFYDTYDSLDKKGKTLLVREVNEGAQDFSGGEKQKLMFTRALYKQAPLLILDEPTAALDPIAENELYQNLGEAVRGRTSIYISHRLSSTRFCDRILLLEHGRVIEEGTHETLMAGNTRYAQLFELQSRYYREEEERRRMDEMMGDAYAESAEKKKVVFDE